MSQTKSLGAPKASFDRRAVVKGAAWSVPVIAAAIAAPAAAASPNTATMALAARTQGVSFKGKANRTATVSTGFTISNTPGAAIPAGIIVQVSITGAPQVSLNAMSGGIVTTAGAYAAGAYTIYFQTTASIAGGANQLFTFSGFSHEAAGNDNAAYSYNFKVAFSIPGNQLEASSTLNLNA